MRHINIWHTKMQTAITPTSTPRSHNPLRALIPVDGDRRSKDAASRLAMFCDWLDSAGENWYAPDLAQWRDALLAEGKTPATVKAYLSTVRGAYRRLMRDNATRDSLYSLTPPGLPAADRKAFVDELLTRLDNAIQPSAAPVRETIVQDRADSERLRLTSQQARQLLHAPDVDSLQGIRDTAVIAMLLCTGIREDELCSLDTQDLRQHLGGELALRVRHGKGNKQRLVPYGDMDWCLAVVDKWLQRAGAAHPAAASGPVFRGLHKGETMRRERLTPRSVQRILARYPIVVDGREVVVQPHDLRRTYARLMYDAGLELVAIKDNLGHAGIETTLGYIGTLDAAKRRAKGVVQYDLRRLRDA